MTVKSSGSFPVVNDVVGGVEPGSVFSPKAGDIFTPSSEATMGGPGLTEVAKLAPEIGDSFVCLKGPCRHYLEFMDESDSQDPWDWIEFHRFCLALQFEQGNLETTDDVVLGCTKYDPPPLSLVGTYWRWLNRQRIQRAHAFKRQGIKPAAVLTAIDPWSRRVARQVLGVVNPVAIAPAREILRRSVAVVSRPLTRVDEVGGALLAQFVSRATSFWDRVLGDPDTNVLDALAAQPSRPLDSDPPEDPATVNAFVPPAAE